MSQLTSQAPSATTDGAGAMNSAAPYSPGPYGRLRIWTRLCRAVQEMTYSPSYPSELHIRWP